MAGAIRRRGPAPPGFDGPALFVDEALQMMIVLDASESRFPSVSPRPSAWPASSSPWPNDGAMLRSPIHRRHGRCPSSDTDKRYFRPRLRGRRVGRKPGGVHPRRPATPLQEALSGKMPVRAAYLIPQRLLTGDEVSVYLGHSGIWFARNRARLEETGFPKPIAELDDRWDRAAIDAWLDTFAQNGLVFSG